MSETNTVGTKIEGKELAVVPGSELESIYRSGRVSPDVQGVFKSSLSKNLYSSQGVSIDQFIETNRRIKVEMKEYLDNYKVQRGLMEEVIYYIRHPELASVRFVDRVGGMFGKHLQLEAKKIANDPHAIRRLFEEMALSIDQSRGKTLELEKQATALYNISLSQRDEVEKEITNLLQQISVNKDLTIKLEDDYNKVKDNMGKLLKYMQEKLEIRVKGDRPILDEETLKALPPAEEIDIDKIIKGDNKSEIINDQSKDVTITNKNTETEDVTRIKERKRIEAIKVYHSINNQLVKAENSLRDARSEKLVFHQRYERAKENLTLYEKVLINQVNEARNYFKILFAIYDAEVRFTLPSARLIAHLASLQEVVIQLTQQIYDSRNIFNNLLDSVTRGALDIQEGIIILAINPSWDPEKIDQAESRTVELANRTRQFALEMDKRLTEIETAYRNPTIRIKLNEKDSGIDDEYLQKLLTDK